MPSVSFDWNEAAAQLTRYTGGWQPTFGTPLTITYAYRETANAPSGPFGIPAGSWIGGLPENATGFSQFSAGQIGVMEVVLDLIESVANITFNRAGTGTSGAGAYSDSAEILLGNFSGGSLASEIDGIGYWQWATSGPDIARAGKAFFDISAGYVANPTAENAGLWLYLHEIMHTIAISHPGDYDGVGGGSPTYLNDAEYIQDSAQYTVMSYFSEQETGAFWGSYYPMTLMMHDIAALQLLFGANTTTRTGASVYGFNSNTGLQSFTFTSANDARVFTIWDAGGLDTLDLSGFTTNSVIDLRAEHFSSGGLASPGNPMSDNIAIARGVVIENAVGGSGNDAITGNSAANDLRGNVGADSLDGGAGADKLNGGAGNDTMIGGTGNDTYAVNAAGDVTTESSASGGVDLVQSSVTRTLGANLEKLTLTGSGAINGTGNSLDNVLTGNVAANTLNGGSGGDTLMGGLGLDTLIGGNGNDKFVFDTTPAAANRDTITDYNVVADTIQLDNAVFTALGAVGVLAAAKFHIGAGAHDANDRIIYNSATGALYYDSNGITAGGKFQVATLSTGLLLTAADFVVI